MSEPISWLGALIPSLTPETEVMIFTSIVPLILFVVICLNVIMTVLMPKSGWVRFRARLAREGVLVSLFTDEGFEKTELMKSDLGQGILSGNPVSYIFTPRPPVITQGDKELVDLSEDVTANLNEALSHRLFTDTGKPLYLGYVGKSVGVTARLLKVIKDVQGKKRLKLKKKAAEAPKKSETLIERKGKPGVDYPFINVEGEGEVQEEELQVKLIELLDPRVLKLWIGKTLSRSLIESIKAENERKGYLRKPAPIEFLSRNSLPVIAILIVILVGLAMFSGNLDILGALGVGG